ncbi:MAG: glycosyltransferase [Desulfobacterales bacterium]|nr:glycosyltransferase [Desulfobacterales bacterium]
MKVVFVIDSWNGGNGSVVATKRIVEELMNRGHKITVVSTGQHKGDYEFYEVPGFFLPGVRQSLEKMDFLFARGKKSVLRKAFKGADLVQVQLPFFIARNAVKVAKKMGIPVTGACHVQPQNIISAMGKENPLMEKILYALFNFLLYKRVDSIHCPSSFAARMQIDHGSKAHLKVISNGIPREYKPSKEKRPEWFGDKFTILNIGRFAMEKRQELLIDGVLKSKYKNNIQLLLCGKGEDSEKLKKRGEELPIKPLIDFVSVEDKLLYLNTSDLYLHSSVVDLESLSCLEAIGCGLPCLIVNSPHSAAPQFALDERFLFEVDDAGNLAKQIDFWYEKRNELKELKKSILEMAGNYRVDKCITEMEEFFEESVRGKLKTNEITGAVTGIQQDYYLNLSKEVLAAAAQK